MATFSVFDSAEGLNVVRGPVKNPKQIQDSYYQQYREQDGESLRAGWRLTTAAHIPLPCLRSEDSPATPKSGH
jgi:hypothetical protein